MSRERSGQHLDLLRQAPAMPAAGARGDHADALAQSRHSRVETPAPARPREPAHAGELCAAVCRQFLRDLSPALMLLDRGTRHRIQALAAWTFTLFDFARQRGTEGERLAQINQWEFTLERALAGELTAQPIFDRMAEEHQVARWPEEALDAVVSEARRRVGSPRPSTAEDAQARALRLAEATLHALTGAAPGAEVTHLVAVVLRAAVLRDLAEETRQHRSPLPTDLLPLGLAGEDDSERAVTLARRELSELAREAARSRGRLGALPRHQRRALGFALGAVGHWSRQAAALDLSKQAPRLGLGARLALLVRSRL